MQRCRAASADLRYAIFSTLLAVVSSNLKVASHFMYVSATALFILAMTFLLAD